MNKKNKKKAINKSLEITGVPRTFCIYVCACRKSILTGNRDYILLKVGRTESKERIMDRLYEIASQIGGTPVLLFALDVEVFLKKQLPNNLIIDLDTIEGYTREFFRASFITGSGICQGGLSCLCDAKECIYVPEQELLDPNLSSELFCRFVKKCLEYSKENSEFYNIKYSLYWNYTKGVRELLKTVLIFAHDPDLTYPTQLRHWYKFKEQYEIVFPIEIRKQMSRRKSYKRLGENDETSTVTASRFKSSELEKLKKDLSRLYSKKDTPPSLSDVERKRAGDRCLATLFRNGDTLWWAEAPYNRTTGERTLINMIEVVVVDANKNIIRPKNVDKYGNFTGTPTEFTKMFISEETRKLHTRNTWEGFRYLYIDAELLYRLDKYLPTT